MTQSRPDSLLMAAKLLVGFLIVLAIIIVTAMGIAITALLGVWISQHPEFIKGLAEHAPGTPQWHVMTAILLILGLVMLMSILGVRWLQTLKAIIDSVSDGDPFVPDNADRLQRMGWLTVWIEVLSIPVGGIGGWLASTFKDATSEFGLSLGGLLLAMVLFILARVFREGAAMRADLEGTV